MVDQRNDCPAESVIRDYLDGTSDAQHNVKIESHLSQCDACESIAQRIESEAYANVPAAHDFRVTDGAPNDLLARLKQIPSATTDSKFKQPESVGESDDLIGSQLGRYQILDRICLLYTSPSPRDRTRSRMPSSA